MEPWIDRKMPSAYDLPMNPEQLKIRDLEANVALLRGRLDALEYFAEGLAKRMMTMAKMIVDLKEPEAADEAE